MSVEISRLADHPELIGQLVRGYEACWPRWYGPDGRGDAHADLAGRARTGRLPVGLVAVDAGVAAGTCALAAESMSPSGEFDAWLVGLWVAPTHRRRGIASELIGAAMQEARALGLTELRASTATAVSIFERAGWTRLGPIVHEGEEVEVFSVRP